MKGYSLNKSDPIRQQRGFAKKLTKLLVAVIVSSLLPSSLVFAQVSGWVVYDGHSYKLTSGEMTWTAAEAEANSNGGNLVAINSSGEQQFLENTFLVGSLDQVAVWIGINDAQTEGTFVWSNGDPVTYTNWQSGEPNDYGDGEDYGCMNWHRDESDGNETKGTWNDCQNGGTFFGPYVGIIEVPRVVESQSVSVPSLTQWGLIILATLLSVLAVSGIRRKRT